MDKAPVSDAGDCEFKSRLGRKKKEGEKKRKRRRETNIINSPCVCCAHVGERACLFVCLFCLASAVGCHKSERFGFIFSSQRSMFESVYFFFRRTHPNPNRQRRPSAVDTPRILIPDL